MAHRLEVHADAAAVAEAAAAHLADAARRAVDGRGAFDVAVSGGRTPWAMFGALGHHDVPWERTTIYQVDERIAPADDPDRNLGHLVESLGGTPADVRAMPVEDTDPDAAADRYAAALPDRFDLVHLGLGADGHTASLVPGDGVLSVDDRLVATTTGTYRGRRRMTLTRAGLARADALLWLVTGASKADALARLLLGDTSIPAGRVSAPTSLVVADEAAAHSSTGGAR